MAVRRLALVMALAVSACAAPPPSARTAVAPAGTQAVPAWSEPHREVMKGAPRPAEAPGLLGLLSVDVEGMFGRPRFVRRDGPAQIWQYGTDICTLNLFLYREGPIFKVRHVEFRDRSADLVSSGGCDGALISMVQPKSF